MRYLIIAISGIIVGACLLAFSRARPLSQPRPFSASIKNERVPAARASGSRAVSSPLGPRITKPSADTDDLMVALQKDSSRAWLISQVQGRVLRMSGARLSMNANSPREAASKFLLRFSPLLGLSSGALNLDKQKQMEGNTQLLYSQALDGLPVFNSRVNMIFDGESNLIYLSSDVYSGAGRGGPAKISPSAASAEAARALAEFRAARGDYGPVMLPSALEPFSLLGYRLLGGNIALVYKFTFTIPNSPLGDIEIFVEDASGAVVAIRTLSRS